MTVMLKSVLLHLGHWALKTLYCIDSMYYTTQNKSNLQKEDWELKLDEIDYISIEVFIFLVSATGYIYFCLANGR